MKERTGERMLMPPSWPPTPLEKLERLEQLRILEHGERLRVLETPWDPVSVDTPEDLERVRKIFAEKQ